MRADERIDFNHVADQADLIDIADRYMRRFCGHGIARAGRGVYRGPCPLHRGDDPNFSVFERNGRWLWKCMSHECGAGNAIQLVERMEGLSRLDAARHILGLPPRSDELPAALEAPRQPLGPLQAAAAQYAGLVNLQIAQATTPRDLWHALGMTDEVIGRYHLGYCPVKRYRAHDALYASPSLTIPIVAGGQVVTIRHRLIEPVDSSQRYRPERAGDGAHLFNADGIEAAGEVVIMGGEKKVLRLETVGFRETVGVWPVCLTSGEGGWLGPQGPEFVARLAHARQVYVLMDPDAPTRDRAERTAKLFGRRGVVVRVPEKVDDYLNAHEDRALLHIINAFQHALPPGLHPARLR